LKYTAGMPSRNRVKQWAPGYAYHLYNRGNNKQNIFLDSEDYAVFINLLKRHLQKKQTTDKLGRQYKNWYGDIELLAYCLMPNHYHLLAFQRSENALTKLISSVTTSYAGYFNKKYNRVGRIFQDTFKASLIDEESYWQHISRYIHLNPKVWETWEWSSLPYYLDQKHSDWLRPKKVLSVFEGEDYLSFVGDYESHKEMLAELKFITAD